MGNKLIDLSFSDLLTDLGFDPSSMINLEEDARERMLVNFMGFGGGSNQFSYLLEWWKP